MARAERIFAVTSLVAAAAAFWLYLDNRDLRRKLATPPARAAFLGEGSAE
jgi:hypothetical protein